jgi:hypothetical protein
VQSAIKGGPKNCSQLIDDSCNIISPALAATDAFLVLPINDGDVPLPSGHAPILPVSRKPSQGTDVTLMRQCGSERGEGLVYRESRLGAVGI